jgi:hypothetical protein
MGGAEEVTLLALTMTMRMLGPVEWLTNELASTRSSRRRQELIRKLALSHDPAVISTIAPYLDGDARVRRAAVLGILHFAEEARPAMLDVLRDPDKVTLHPGALEVLAALTRRRLAMGQ